MASVLNIEDGAYHGLIDASGQFPPEKGRYHLYIGGLALPNN
jgi:putative glutathione S-transferase